MRELIKSFTKKDFRVDTFRASGSGGQNVNKRDTAVRITHIESGLSASCQEHRTQKQKKREAFRKLANLLREMVKKEYSTETERKIHQFGGKYRRTYSEADDRVTDHLTGKDYSYKMTVGKGDLSEVIEEALYVKSDTDI